MNSDQQLTLRRLTNALNKRYAEMNGELCDAIDVLENMFNVIDKGDSLSSAIEDVLRLLTSAADEGAELQSEVIDALHRQLAQSRSAKKAYEQGWEAYLPDLLGRATPEQAAIIRALVIDSGDDDDDMIPF